MDASSSTRPSHHPIPNTLRCRLYSPSLPSSKHVLPRSLPHGVHAGWRRRFHGAIGDRAICVATDKQLVHGGRYLPGRKEDQGQRRRPPEDGCAEGGLQGSVRLRGGQVRDVRAQGERQEDQAVHRQASCRRRPIHVHAVNRRYRGRGRHRDTERRRINASSTSQKGQGSSDWQPPPAP